MLNTHNTKNISGTEKEVTCHDPCDSFVVCQQIFPVPNPCNRCSRIFSLVRGDKIIFIVVGLRPQRPIEVLKVGVDMEVRCTGRVVARLAFLVGKLHIVYGDEAVRNPVKSDLDARAEKAGWVGEGHHHLHPGLSG